MQHKGDQPRAPGPGGDANVHGVSLRCELITSVDVIRATSSVAPVLLRFVLQVPLKACCFVSGTNGAVTCVCHWN